MKNNPQNQIVLWIGIDWADRKHDAYVIDEQGSGQHETFLQNAESIEKWIEQKLEQAGGKPIGILIEKASNGLFHALLFRKNVVLFAVNPKQVARYRQSYSNAGNKDDKNDARLMARMLRERQHLLSPIKLNDQQTRLLDNLCRGRRQLVDQRAQSVVRLKSQLKASFPLLLELNLTLNTILALLKRWPDPRQLKRAQVSTLTKVLRESGVRKEEKIDHLVKRIRDSKLLTTDPALHIPMAMVFKTEARIISELNRGIESLDQAIEKNMKTHQDAKLFSALPGAGKALAPRLLTAFGSDRERFRNADEVAGQSGIAPVTKQSGKSKQVMRRYACPSYLRQTFHQFADHAAKWCPWSKAYYRLQRSRGMKHHAALRKLAYRWIRILFQVWKTRIAYNSQKYIQSIIKKNPNILQFLDQKNIPQTT